MLWRKFDEFDASRGFRSWALGMAPCMAKLPSDDCVFPGMRFEPDLSLAAIGSKIRKSVSVAAVALVVCVGGVNLWQAWQAEPSVVATVLDVRGQGAGGGEPDIRSTASIHPGAILANSWQESVAQANATNDASALTIAGLSFAPHCQVQFLSATNRLYTLHWCTNLAGGVWRTVPGQVRVAGTDGPITLSDTNASGGGRFYRLRVDLPNVQDFSGVSAATALEMIVDRQNDSDFVLLDVRTAGEYATRHIRSAINRDYYAGDFAAQLDVLDRNKAYLVYCRTGSRSGRTYDIMRGLGFHEVYNMLGGIEAFQTVSGAEVWLEP